MLKFNLRFFFRCQISAAIESILFCFQCNHYERDASLRTKGLKNNHANSLQGI